MRSLCFSSSFLCSLPHLRMWQYLQSSAFWVADVPNECVSSWRVSYPVPQECRVLGAELPLAHFVGRVNLFIFVCSVYTWLDLRLERIAHAIHKPFLFISQRSQVFQSSDEKPKMGMREKMAFVSCSKQDVLFLCLCFIKVCLFL